MWKFIEKYLDREFEGQIPLLLIDSPAHAISGISKEDNVKLRKALGINTIHDLANNKYVNIAQAITIFSEFSDAALDKEYESEKFKNLTDAPVSAIAGISKEDATLLMEAFKIKTIRDLAECKYVKIAQIISGLALIQKFLPG